MKLNAWDNTIFSGGCATLSGASAGVLVGSVLGGTSAAMSAFLGGALNLWIHLAGESHFGRDPDKGSSADDRPQWNG